jgi:hypothetical protein
MKADTSVWFGIVVGFTLFDATGWHNAAVERRAHCVRRFAINPFDRHRKTSRVTLPRAIAWHLDARRSGRLAAADTLT